MDILLFGMCIGFLPGLIATRLDQTLRWPAYLSIGTFALGTLIVFVFANNDGNASIFVAIVLVAMMFGFWLGYKFGGWAKNLLEP